jgi:Uncharacterized protein involved in formation of curli polymers
MLREHHLKLFLLLTVSSVGLAGMQGCSGPTDGVIKDSNVIQAASISNSDSQVDMEGIKARIAVMDFEQKMSENKFYQASYGSSLQDMLATALVKTGRFTVLERAQLQAVLNEQNLGAAGLVSKETAAEAGKINGAEFLVQGAITAFDPGTERSSSGVGSAVGAALGFLVPGASLISQAIDKVSRARVAMEVRVVNASTGSIVTATNVEETALGVAGFSGAFDAASLGSMSAFAKTPMEKAIRACVERAAKFIVANAPQTLAIRSHEGTAVVGLSMKGSDR